MCLCAATTQLAAAATGLARGLRGKQPQAGTKQKGFSSPRTSHQQLSSTSHTSASRNQCCLVVQYLSLVEYLRLVVEYLELRHWNLWLHCTAAGLRTSVVGVKRTASVLVMARMWVVTVTHICNIHATYTSANMSHICNSHDHDCR